VSAIFPRPAILPCKSSPGRRYRPYCVRNIVPKYSPWPVGFSSRACYPPSRGEKREENEGVTRRCGEPSGDKDRSTFLSVPTGRCRHHVVFGMCRGSRWGGITSGEACSDTRHSTRDYSQLLALRNRTGGIFRKFVSQRGLRSLQLVGYYGFIAARSGSS
jgi:hypothetical protein